MNVVRLLRHACELSLVAVCGLAAIRAENLNVVTQYGADPTCNVDATDVINKALADAAASGKTAYLPAGCYAHFSLIVLNGAKLTGAGDATELRATGTVKTFSVSSWSVNPGGTITLNVSGNRHIVPGSPIDVAGLRGYQCSGDPNGLQTASDANQGSVKFSPKGVSCSGGSGNSGTVANKFPLTAVVMQGSGAELRSVKATVQWPGGRTGLNQSAAVLNVATNFVFDHVHIIGSGGSPGYYCVGCTHGSETNSIVERSKADGMEHHACAGFITNSNNRALATGDDAYSVNSYNTDSCPSHDITFTNDVAMNGLARGYDVDGGTNITFTGGSITSPKHSCIFIHSGGDFKTLRSDTVTVDGTTLNGCGEAGVYVSGEGGGEATTTNITIRNIRGSGITTEGIHIGEPNGTTSGIHIINCSFESKSGGAHPAVFLAPASKQIANVQMQGVTFKGFGQQCIGDPGGHVGGITNTAMTCDGKSINEPHQGLLPH